MTSPPHDVSHFNPRSPCGERLIAATTEQWEIQISIHAPRVGSDKTAGGWTCSNSGFQSTLPVWGATYENKLQELNRKFQSTLPVWGATCIAISAMQSSIFQSTLPVWGATVYWFSYATTPDISIHAPRVGSDALSSNRLDYKGDFNPRSPCGERRADTGRHGGNQHFNPRSPCGERRTTGPPRW